MSQRALADKIGVTAGAISQFEGAGKKRSQPSIDTLNDIIEALGLTTERFYGRVPKTRRAS